jgi:hypothetical protein
MAEVKLYIYSGTSQGNPLKLNAETSVSRDFTTADADGSTKEVTYTYPLMLNKLTYQKKMYEPCAIHAVVEVGMGTTKEGTTESSLKSLPTHREMAAFFSKMKVKCCMGDTTVAMNYRVFNVRTFRKKDHTSSVTVELDIFSEDKLLTLEKYSKAYSGKRLGAQIFADEVGKYALSATPVVNLQLLSYDASGSKEEFRQPYLVQYNESFYDFLKRTANRCGEFLYYENGHLNLGVTLNRLDEKESATDYGTVARQLHFDTLYAFGGFKDDKEAEDYAYNYMGDTHFSSNDNQYNDPLAIDDYLGEISKDYTSYGDEVDDMGKRAMAQILLALSGTSFSEIFSNFITELAFNRIEAAYSARNKNDESKEVNITPWATKVKDKEGNDTDKLVDKDQWSSDKESLTQFGTYGSKKSAIYDKTINLNALFYQQVRKAEKKTGEEALWMDFGSDFQDLKLGDVIKVDDESFLVIQVSGAHEYTDAKTTIAQQQVVAIPLYTVPSESDTSTSAVLPIPQALPGVTVRESQPQLAFVTDVIDPMKIGRVRIRFPWQKEDGDASPWIRVSLPFATDGGGVKFKPEKDDEVLVNFEEGNVERPYVSGYLLSGRSNESWGALSDRAIVSKNGHSIIFDDKPGSDFFYSSIWPFASVFKSFWPTSVWPDTLDKKAGTLALAGGIKLRDPYGLYEISASSDARSVNIQSALGNVTLNAFTGISISAPNGNISISGKNVEISASNNVKITSGKGLNDRFFPSINSTGSFWKDLGIRAADTSIAAVVDSLGSVANKFVDSILDVSLIRTVIEIVLRPIDGTTTIKSHTFIQMEAGKGSVEFPKSALKKNPGDPTTFTDIRAILQSIPATVNEKVTAINNVITALKADIDAYNAISGDGDDLVNKQEQCIKFDAIKVKGCKATADTLKDTDAVFTWTDALKDVELLKEEDEVIQNLIKTSVSVEITEKPKSTDDCYKDTAKPKRNFQNDLAEWEKYADYYLTELNKPKNEENRLRADRRKTLVDCAQKLANSFSDLYNVIDGIDNLANLTGCPNTVTAANKDKGVASVKEYKTFITAANSALFDKLVNKNVAKDTDLTQPLGDEVKKRWSRKAIHHFMSQVWNDVNAEFKDSIAMKTPATPADVMDDVQWKTDVNGWFEDVQPVIDAKSQIGGFAKDKVVAIKDHWKEEYIDPWIDATVNRRRWQTGVQGKILLSDSPGTTIRFEKDGSTYQQVNALASNKYIYDLRDYLKTF